MNIPDFCYGLNNMTIDPKTKVGDVIVIKALERGYYPRMAKATQEQVDNMNLVEFGIDKPTAQAMCDASMFGWDCYPALLEAYSKLSEYKEEENE